MKRILIVDDDAAVREAYREILVPRGDGFSQTGEGLFGSAPRHLSKKPLSYEIQEAENGAKAGEIVRKARLPGKAFRGGFRGHEDAGDERCRDRPGDLEN